jgi:hypothetical protein
VAVVLGTRMTTQQLTIMVQAMVGSVSLVVEITATIIHHVTQTKLEHLVPVVADIIAISWPDMTACMAFA